MRNNILAAESSDEEDYRVIRGPNKEFIIYPQAGDSSRFRVGLEDVSMAQPVTSPSASIRSSPQRPNKASHDSKLRETLCPERTVSIENSVTYLRGQEPLLSFRHENERVQSRYSIANAVILVRRDCTVRPFHIRIFLAPD